MMGLSRATLEKVIQGAFNALGDIPETITYRRTATTYTPATGSSVITNTDYSIQALFVAYQSFEIDRVTVTTSDVKCLIEARLLTITPEVSKDKIIRSGIAYSILTAKTDPSGNLYTLQLRKSQ